ncbi:MAG: hypothetical protein LUE29_12810 [Lachnospiraceae bacterium]|nr:hypothetical protein [Lachnospiraceae bacterium]
MTQIGCQAFDLIDYIPWYENLTDEFVIVGHGCLIKYNGDDTSVAIPASVTRIGEDAFEECSENLTIHGAAGSRAESYAAEYGINFVVDGEEKTETSVGSAE